MSDTLEVFSVTYTGVNGIKAYDDNGQLKTYVRPQGTKTITQNGTGIDVAEYASVDVSVSAPSPTLQSKNKTYTPTESQHAESVTADNGYDGLSAVNVTVNAVSSSYVGSGITRRSSADLTASGATVTVPSGYYASQGTKSVTTTTHANPTASINSSTGLITASHTQTTGYVSGGTTTGTTQMTTQGATTVTPTTSSQVAVAAGTYTTGAVTVGAIPSNYVDENTIPRVYMGTAVPASSLGSNGDLYFKIQ